MHDLMNSDVIECIGKYKTALVLTPKTI